MFLTSVKWKGPPGGRQFLKNRCQVSVFGCQDYETVDARMVRLGKLSSVCWHLTPWYCLFPFEYGSEVLRQILQIKWFLDKPVTATF